MRKSKGIGISVLLAASLLIGVIFNPAVNAINDGKNDMSIIHINGMTEIRNNIYNQSELKIPFSIKKSDIIILDLNKLDRHLKTDTKVPIHIKGKPYVMELKEIKVNAPGVEDGTHSYSGSIAGLKNSEIVMTFSDKALIGRITLNNVEYTIESIGKNDIINSDKRLHIVYSSEDVVADNVNISKDYKPSISEVKNNSANNLIAENLIIQGLVDVGVLVATDNKWITDEPDWKTKAQNIIAEANNQLGRSDIQVHLTVNTYDDTKKNEMSNDPNIRSDPLGAFTNHFSVSYINGKKADIAVYLGGYPCTCGSAGLAYGYDGGLPLSRYAYAEMAVHTSSHDRAVITLHEIGHMFDADHEDASGQQETYNRAFQWTDWWVFTHRTVMWSVGLNTDYEYSSDNYHGDANHDNARRISETKAAVSNYIT